MGETNFSFPTAIFLWLTIFPFWLILVSILGGFRAVVQISRTALALFHAPGDLWNVICEAREATVFDATDGE